MQPNIFDIDDSYPIDDSTALEVLEAIDKSLKVGMELEFILPKLSQTIKCERYKGDNTDRAQCIDSCLNYPCSICIQLSMCTKTVCRTYAECVSVEKLGQSACSFCHNYLPTCEGCDSYVGYRECNKYCNDFNTNCNVCLKNKNRVFKLKEARDVLNNILRPSQSYTEGHDAGVLEVRHDGSLRNGLEIVTVGERVSFQKLKQQYKRIIEAVNGLNSFTTPRCGTHFHMLLGYYTFATETPNKVLDFNEINVEIPELVLKNLHNLHLYFADCLIWLSSAVHVSSHDFITRCNQYRVIKPLIEKHQAQYGRPFIKTVEAIKKEFTKYGFIHFNNTKINKDIVNRFHMEARYPDGQLSYMFLAALPILEAALFKKAVELSTCGLVYPRTSQEQENLVSRILSIAGNEVTEPGDAERAALFSAKPELVDDIKTRTIDMLNFLKGEILFYGKEPWIVLTEMARLPASYRLKLGNNWSDIDKSLEQLIDKENKESSLKGLLVKAIKLHQISADTMDEWIYLAADRFGVTDKKLFEEIESLRNIMSIVWDNDARTLIIIK